MNYVSSPGRVERKRSDHNWRDPCGLVLTTSFAATRTEVHFTISEYSKKATKNTHFLYLVYKVCSTDILL